jgi:hypothetical protein
MMFIVTETQTYCVEAPSEEAARAVLELAGGDRAIFIKEDADG